MRACACARACAGQDPIPHVIGETESWSCSRLGPSRPPTKRPLHVTTSTTTTTTQQNELVNCPPSHFNPCCSRDSKRSNFWNFIVKVSSTTNSKRKKGCSLFFFKSDDGTRTRDRSPSLRRSKPNQPPTTSPGNREGRLNEAARWQQV